MTTLRKPAPEPLAKPIKSMESPWHPGLDQSWQQVTPSALMTSNRLVYLYFRSRMDKNAAATWHSSNGFFGAGAGNRAQRSAAQLLHARIQPIERQGIHPA